MQITTLGALAVDGQPVRGERLAALVGALLDARGRVVSSAALVEQVWEGLPPDDAGGAVQALVSRARRLGLPVAGAPGGYRLPTDDLDIDAARVERLLGEARTALRDGDPRTAYELAGRARQILPSVPDPTDPLTERLVAEAVTVRAESGLALGDTSDVVDDLRLRALGTPPDEPLVALLVRVLAAQSRDAEALEVVDRVRTELADRYGTDPSPVLAQAHLALLRGELAATTSREPAATPPRVHLPAAWRRPATALVGRDEEVAELEAALTSSSLVTIVATGGAGKTRLATEVARRAAAAGRSVRVIELAGVRAPAEVLPTVLAAIGGADVTASRVELAIPRQLHSPEDRLRLAMQDIDGLLVLDNCEHVLDAAASVVGDLLAVAADDVVVLATSRAPLGLVGEAVHRLRMLPDTDALTLLEARARAGRAGVGWEPQRALELCHRLDNLPLALELAAARLRSMAVEDVLEGLTDRFSLLDDALRGLPERHASLWAMVDWSRELLETADQDLLQRVSVIPAAFTAETAIAVAGTQPHIVRRGLATLVEQSLLSLDDHDSGVVLYRMLETVREYGEARLDAAGERPDAMTGLVRWAGIEAGKLSDKFVGPTQVAAFERCAQQQESFLAALRWALEHDDEVAPVRIAAALFHLWSVRGAHLEVLEWAHQILRSYDPAARRRSALYLGAASGRPLPDADRVAMTCLFAAVNGGVSESFRIAALAGRATKRVMTDRPEQVSPRASALAALLPGLATNDMSLALGAADRMIANDDLYLRGLGLFMRAAIRENAGDPSMSSDDAREAYRAFEAAGDHWGMGMAAQGAGQWAGARGEPDAEEWLLRSVDHLEVVGAQHDVRSIKVLLDVQRALAGDESAVERLREVTSSEQVEDMDIAQAHLGLAHVAWAAGDFDDAIANAEAATALIGAGAVGPPQARILFRVAAAVVHLRSIGLGRADDRGSEQRALELLELAGQDAQTMVDMPVLGSYALGVAELAAHRGRTADARELWSLGIRLGANLAMLFQLGLGSTLASTLGDDDAREETLALWRDRPGPEVAARIRELGPSIV
ncbi:BTAD domain-containing putative transcriptional regulator [Cellulomonas sp. URHE0023]|uniref:BTAD domain-containing putative transcriptional regulator n=1 Tax=Cellulomonas sp. URHE0023 TaxID=1380354 RepID=UPI000486D320|nr:BTAD domain-containing putative transcriptional regulator [Cellulomonas sp. URHE0023]